MKHILSLLVAPLVFFACFAPALADDIDFNRDVRPILSDKCYHCHGPDEQNRKANLRLDTFDGSRKAVTGDTVEAMKFHRRITSKNPDKRMPPADANFAKELSAKEIAVLTKWLGAGAKYSKHWAFETPVAGKLPEAVAPQWEQPIDRFIAARLAKAGLKPAPRADKATLIRRVSLDLTGLPPTPQEVDAFLKDDSADAYEKVVDRLLQSPRYGERMALHWMDLARYGDSSVYHADGFRDMWAWRDGVIRAFNQNQRFDQFTLEQLAGDLLPNATPEQKAASGFNRNHATTDEGGVIPEEFRVDYVIDRVKTTANVWMAMSLECSQCHDHKYDPLSQKEYYQFFAFFNNTKDGGMQTRNGNTAPLVSVPDSESAMMLKAARDSRQTTEQELVKYRAAKKESKEFLDWLASQKSSESPLTRAPEFFVPLSESGKTNVVSSADGQIAVTAAPLAEAKRPKGNGLKFDGKASLAFAKAPAFSAGQPFTIAVWVQVADKGGGGPIASQLGGTDGFQIAIDAHMPALTIKHSGGAAKIVAKAKLPSASWHHVVFSGDGKSAGDIKLYVDGAAVEVDLAQEKSKDDGAIKEAPLRIGEGIGGAKFVGGLDDVCLYRDRFDAPQIKLCAADPVVRMLAAPAPMRQDAMVFDHYLRTADAVYPAKLREMSKSIDDERKYSTAATNVMIMEDLPSDKMRTTYVLNRGQYDKPMKNQPVKAGVPAALPALPKDAPGNRLGLAQWLVQPNHPLTARVAVNRFWQLAFGEGLVRTTEDFGLQGEMPSHSELLDWLAVDFVKSDWDIKRAMKQIVTSSTYCQDSRFTPQSREADPENRLLSRGPRIRLQGEFIRDNALFVSGLLVEKVGGRSVKPYQPPGLWEECAMSGEKYVPDHGDKLYRRSMYTFWKRTVPHPAMLTFDAPSREKCTGYRARTNTPLQALVTLNDPQFVEAARVFAQRIVKNGGTQPAERIQFAYRHALGRPATEKEVAVMEKLLTLQQARFTADGKKAESLVRVGESPRDAAIPVADHAAWTIVASTLLNLDEFLVKN